MNKLELTGKLTKDPELRYTSTNLAHASLNIYEADEKTFLDIVCWQELAEYVKNNFSKDDELKIEAYARKRSYENSDHKKVYITEIIAKSVELIDNVPRETSQEPEVSPYDFNNRSDEPFADFGNTIELSDDDIAF